MWKNSSLWLSTLNVTNDSPNKDKQQELQDAYIRLRENITLLVSKISGDMPLLTLHDISHLDALWETASIIVGKDYVLNPLEGFILGASILIHDSALCVEAFEGGLEEIRAHLVWQDTYQELKKAKGYFNDDDCKRDSDFLTLRMLHAQQSENMLSRKWGEDELYLLENQRLRNHYGRLIGQIASSHFWDIEKVFSQFSDQQNPLGDFPTEWTIDTVKLACILRCADAVHLDNRRAPDFLIALIKREGMSANHWIAQNRLSFGVNINQRAYPSLIFTSTSPFTEKEFKAWYIIHDALVIADKEIKQCNIQLQKIEKAPFEIQGISGIESPEALSKYIQTEGWVPRIAQLHVSNVEKLVTNFGGELLYGKGSNFVGIALRELLQNARDAVVARKHSDKDFMEKIKVKLTTGENDECYIVVEDNGVGMSERVLTGTMLDFGNSLWASDLVKTEFPGLVSSDFQSIGRYGIGFYSVFMAAESVEVTSKNWKKGLEDLITIKFPDGISLKPIIAYGEVEDFSTQISTRIVIRVKSGLLNNSQVRLRTTWTLKEHIEQNVCVDIEEYLKPLCAGLDVPVYFQQNPGEEVILHAGINEIVTDENMIKSWMKGISMYKTQPDALKWYIETNSKRLQPIYEEDNLVGLAAISTMDADFKDYLCVNTVGGLAETVGLSRDRGIMGWLDCKVESLDRRANDPRASEEAMKNWAYNQLGLLLKCDLDETEKFIGSANLCNFGVDPSELALIQVYDTSPKTHLTINELCDLAESKTLVFLESISGYQMETYFAMRDVNIDYGAEVLIIPKNCGYFISLKLEDSGEPAEPNSILGCIYREILRRGKKTHISKKKNVGFTLWKEPIDALLLTSTA